MEMKGILKDIRNLLDRGKGPLLAHRLGYKSITTLYNWLEKKAVPTWRVTSIQEVLKQIKEEEKKSA